MNQKVPLWQNRTDRWVAILGSSIPVGFVLGVVVYEFIISLTGLVWLIARIKYPVHRERIYQNLLFWPICSWFLSVMISRLINGGTAFQFAHDFAFIRFPLLLIAMLEISDRIPVHRYLLRGLFIGIAYAALNLLCAHLVGFDFIGKPLARYLGKLNEGARIGALCTYAAPFLLIWGVIGPHRNQRRRLEILFSGFISIFLIISSRVRTALMAATIGLAGGLLSHLIIRRRLKPVAVLALLSVAGLGMWGVIRLQPSLGSIYDRVYFWEVSWKVWLHNPVFGVGISSFNEAYRQIAESGLVPAFAAPNGIVYHSVNPRHAHNLFLQLLACNGLVGLATFFWVFLNAIRIVRRHFSSWPAGLSSWPFICVGIGLTGWNIYDPFYTTLIFYFLTFIAISAEIAGYGHKEPQALPA